MGSYSVRKKEKKKKKVGRNTWVCIKIDTGLYPSNCIYICDIWIYVGKKGQFKNQIWENLLLIFSKPYGSDSDILHFGVVGVFDMILIYPSTNSRWDFDFVFFVARNWVYIYRRERKKGRKASLVCGKYGRSRFVCWFTTTNMHTMMSHYSFWLTKTKQNIASFFNGNFVINVLVFIFFLFFKTVFLSIKCV